MRLTADYPKAWLLGFLAIAWGLGRIWPHGPSWLILPGWIFLIGGLILMLLAARHMRRRGTTLDPHGSAQALVTDGIFALSRNPIYLGDALVIAGAALIWAAPITILLVPVFVWVITQRFILREEAYLTERFPQEFAAYRSRTRRWI